MPLESGHTSIIEDEMQHPTPELHKVSCQRHHVQEAHPLKQHLLRQHYGSVLRRAPTAGVKAGCGSGSKKKA